MKITKFLLLSLAVIFFSCSEDEDPKPTSQGMVGDWAMSSLEYNGTTTTSFEGASYKADFTGTGKDMDFITTFAENPNTVSSEGSYTIVLKTTMMGQTTTEEVDFDEVITDGTWTLNGKTLTITNASGTQTATIVEQSATTLKVKIDLDDTQTDSGVSINYILHATYTFTKK